MKKPDKPVGKPAARPTARPALKQGGKPLPPPPRKPARVSKKAAEHEPAAETRKSMGTLMISILLHAGLIGVALILVVQRYFATAPEPAFTPPPRTVKLPAQIREQALSVAKHDAAAPRPSFSKRVASAAPSAVVVPAMPEVNLGKMLPLDPSELVSDQISGMIGAGGYGRGTGRGLGGGGGIGGGSGIAFFDIRDSARSVVIMIDVSQSMFSRTGDYDSTTRKPMKVGAEQSFQVVRDEAVKLVNSLGPDTRFGIVRWSGSARPWKRELVRATDANKAEAREHISQAIDVNTAGATGGRPGGTRHDYALEELFRLGPETAFMLTDGNATQFNPGGGMTTIPAATLLDQIEAAAKASETVPRIHTIYYMTGADKPEEEDLLKSIARKTKGKFRKVAAAGVDTKEKKDDRDKKDRRRDNSR